MKSKFVYANGLNISQSKKVTKFYFGDFFFKIEKNEKELRFDIYIKNKIQTKEGILKVEDYVDVDYFNTYWNGIGNNNPGWNVIFIKEEKQQ